MKRVFLVSFIVLALFAACDSTSTPPPPTTLAPDEDMDHTPSPTETADVQPSGDDLLEELDYSVPGTQEPVESTATPTPTPTTDPESLAPGDDELLAELAYSPVGGGGGRPEECFNGEPFIYHSWTRSNATFPNFEDTGGIGAKVNINGCAFPLDTDVLMTLFDPNGNIILQQTETPVGELGSFSVQFWPVPGDLPGTYYVLAETAASSYEYQIDVTMMDRPAVGYGCGMWAPYQTLVLAGFQPDEVVRLGVYAITTELSAESDGTVSLIDTWVEQVGTDGTAIIDFPGMYHNQSYFVVVLGQERGISFYTNGELDTSGWASANCVEG